MGSGASIPNSSKDENSMPRISSGRVTGLPQHLHLTSSNNNENLTLFESSKKTSAVTITGGGEGKITIISNSSIGSSSSSVGRANSSPHHSNNNLSHSNAGRRKGNIAYTAGIKQTEPPVVLAPLKGRFLFLGLNNSGKTTLIQLLSSERKVVVHAVFQERYLENPEVDEDSEEDEDKVMTPQKFNLATDSPILQKTPSANISPSKNGETNNLPIINVLPLPPPSTSTSTTTCIIKNHVFTGVDCPGRPCYRHEWYNRKVLGLLPQVDVNPSDQNQQKYLTRGGRNGSLGDLPVNESTSAFVIPKPIVIKTARYVDTEKVLRCIIFVVDVGDPNRFPSVIEEIRRLGKEESLASIPVLVIGNKCDGIAKEKARAQALKDEERKFGKMPTNNNNTTTPTKENNRDNDQGSVISMSTVNKNNSKSKSDMNMSPSELSSLLNLPKYLRNGSRMWTVRCVTALDIQSLNDALLWAVEERWEKYDAK